MKRSVLMFAVASLSLGFFAPTARGQQIVVTADRDMKNVPVSVKLNEPGKAKAYSLQTEDGKILPAQLTQGGKLCFLLPSIKGNTPMNLTLRDQAGKSPGFTAKLSEGAHRDTYYGDQLVARYMFTPLDDSTPNQRFLTYKPFHHVFDPQTGKTRLTAGPDKGPKARFPHHRGIFFGFNRITYGDTRADVWHCRGDDHQLHEKFLASSTGPVMDESTSRITWRGKGKEPFAEEDRTLTFYRPEGAIVVDFQSEVRPTVDVPVKLDGDPQHAGVQFRAAHEVANETSKQTYYVRPDGKGKLGETRNWSPKTAEGNENLPWKAMSIVVDGQRYTVVYLDHPDNPKPSRYSERDYGRFGSYFEYTLTKDKPLRVKYRFWIQPGEMTVEECEALSQAFTNPPKVRVSRE